ncbi:MAG TPA: M23 family metallopeptidase [Terriglobia bacterium]|nr:M23 family metallopeptidase [Terriglobia bacterium]
MAKAACTLLMFTEVHGKLRKLRLPWYIVQLTLVFCVVGVITVVALANSYARMLLKVSNYNSIRSEREALKSQYRTLENVVNQTNAKLDSLQSLAAEVAQTYGFGEARRPRFPHAILALATQNNSTLESSYRASLYAFRLMRSAGRKAGGEVLGLEFLSDPRLQWASVPSLWPVRGQITAGFGQRMDPFSGENANHSGLDISAPAGSPVVATADGIVLHASPDAGYGNEILLDHGDGFATRYGHLSRISVAVGQEVKQGQIIGRVGMTGKTTGPHLHYEVLVHESPVNPVKYLRPYSYELAQLEFRSHP